MNAVALGQATAAAVGIAVSPVSVATAILLLLSRRGRAPAVGFLVGWAGGIAVAVTAFVVVSAALPAWQPAAARLALGVVEIAVGTALVAIAVVLRLFRRGTAPEERGVPRWLRAVDTAAPAVTAGVGLAMAVNPPNLLLSLAGGVAIAGAGLPPAAVVFSIAAFTAVGASTVLLPISADASETSRVRPVLTRVRSWLERRGAITVTIVLVTVGVLAAVSGFALIRSA